MAEVKDGGQAQHAPGPWRVGEHGDMVAAGRDCVDGGDIVCMYPQLHDASMRYWKANARLIAAAPDLLAALKSAKAFIMNGAALGYITMPTIEADPAYHALPRIIAAIAKAEGLTHG